MISLYASRCLSVSLWFPFKSTFPERHPKAAEQFTGLVVISHVGDERDVHALREIDLVRVDFRENHLFGQAHAVVAVAVKALGIDAAEIANTRQSNADEA